MNDFSEDFDVTDAIISLFFNALFLLETHRKESSSLEECYEIFTVDMLAKFKETLGRFGNFKNMEKDIAEVDEYLKNMNKKGN